MSSQDQREAPTQDQAEGWYENVGGEFMSFRCHLSKGNLTVMRRTDGRGFMWWVDCPHQRSSAEGLEFGNEEHAKSRAMAVYLVLTAEHRSP